MTGARTEVAPKVVARKDAAGPIAGTIGMGHVWSRTAIAMTVAARDGAAGKVPGVTTIAGLAIGGATIDGTTTAALQTAGATDGIGMEIGLPLTVAMIAGPVAIASPAPRATAAPGRWPTAAEIPTAAKRGIITGTTTTVAAMPRMGGITTTAMPRTIAITIARGGLITAAVADTTVITASDAIIATTPVRVSVVTVSAVIGSPLASVAIALADTASAGMPQAATDSPAPHRRPTAGFRMASAYGPTKTERSARTTC